MANEETRNLNQPTPEEKKPGNAFLLCVIPFLLLNLLISSLVILRPRFELHTGESVDFRSAGIELEMHPRLPLAAFDVKFDNTSLNLEDLGGGYCRMSVDKNGTLEVTIRHINGMSRTQYEHIGSIDDQSPLISDEELDGNMLAMSFDDVQSGVDYDSIYGIDANKERVLPRSIDDVAYTAILQITTDRLEIHVPDKLGHEAVYNFSELNVMGNGGDNSHEYHVYGADEKKQGGTVIEDKTLKSKRKRNGGKTEQDEGQTRATKENTSAARASTATSTEAKENQTTAETSTAAPVKAKESQIAARTSTAVPTKAEESDAAKQTSAADTKARETPASAGTKARENSTAAKQTSATGTKTEESPTATKPGNKVNAVNNSDAPAPGETASDGKNGPEESTEPRKSISSIQVVELLNP